MYYSFKEAEGPEVADQGSRLYFVSERVECDLTDACYRIKNIDRSRYYHRSEEVPTCNSTARANFKHFLSKIMIFKFQNLSPPTFLSNHPKPFSVCSRVNLRQIITLLG